MVQYISSSRCFIISFKLTLSVHIVHFHLHGFHSGDAGAPPKPMPTSQGVSFPPAQGEVPEFIDPGFLPVWVLTA